MAKKAVPVDKGQIGIWDAKPTGEELAAEAEMEAPGLGVQELLEKGLSPVTGAALTPLVIAADGARGGCLIPVSPEVEAVHRKKCKVCLLDPFLQIELELRYLSWHPVKTLADEYGVPRGTIRAHARVYLWDLRRLGDLGGAYSRIIECGLSLAENGETIVDPSLTLDALGKLAMLQEKKLTSEDRHVAGPVGELTYEEEVRRTMKLRISTEKGAN